MKLLVTLCYFLPCLALLVASQEPLADALHAIENHCIAKDSHDACRKFEKEQLSQCSAMDTNCQCNKVAIIHSYCRDVCHNSDYVSDSIRHFLNGVCSPDQIILKRSTSVLDGSSDSESVENSEDLNTGLSSESVNDVVEGLALKEMLDNRKLPPKLDSLVEEHLKPAIARIQANIHTGLDATRKTVEAYTNRTSKSFNVSGSNVARSAQKLEIDESKIYLRLPSTGQRLVIPSPYPSTEGYVNSSAKENNPSRPVASEENSSQASGFDESANDDHSEVHYLYYENPPLEYPVYSAIPPTQKAEPFSDKQSPNVDRESEDTVTIFHDVPQTAHPIRGPDQGHVSKQEKDLFSRVRNRLSINRVLKAPGNETDSEPERIPAIVDAANRRAPSVALSVSVVMALILI